MSITPEQLEEIRQECQNEVYGDKLDTGHVGASDFFKWYQWRLEHEPLDGGVPLETFDIDSVISIFEEWVKQPQ